MSSSERQLAVDQLRVAYPNGTEALRSVSFEAARGEVVGVIGRSGAEPYSLHRVGDQVVFSCQNETYGEELWTTDGTTAGTRLLKDLRPGPADSEPYQMTTFRGHAYFVATTDEGGEQLWRSDGTTEGTELVHAIRSPVRTICSSEPRELSTYQGLVFFSAYERATGRELWRSDGTYHGTQLVSDLLPGPAGAHPEQLTVSKAGLHFKTSIDSEETWWRIDDPRDTPSPSEAPSAPTDPHLVRVPDSERTVFAGWAPDTGAELWYQTPDGDTGLLLDLLPGPAGSHPRYFVADEDTVRFTVTGMFGASEEMETDGTVEGTRPLPGARGPHGHVATSVGVVRLIRGGDGHEDRHALGTRNRDLLGLFDLGRYIQPGELAATDTHALFVCDTPESGSELWSVALDLVASGYRTAHRVRDICR